MSERVEHAGYVGVLSNIDGEYLITWRPRDPMWRLPAADTDVECVTGGVYSQVREDWEVAVDTWADFYRDGSCGNAS